MVIGFCYYPSAQPNPFPALAGSAYSSPFYLTFIYSCSWLLPLTMWAVKPATEITRPSRATEDPLADIWASTRHMMNKDPFGTVNNTPWGLSSMIIEA